MKIIHLLFNNIRTIGVGDNVIQILKDVQKVKKKINVESEYYFCGITGIQLISQYDIKI